jgi:penicillin-binding protein 1A
MSIRKIFLYTTILGIILSGYFILLSYGFDRYKSYLLSLIKIPDIEVNNDTTTTKLKVYSANGKLIFEKFTSYGGQILFDKDFKEFDQFYAEFVKVKGGDPLKEELWKEFYKKHENIKFSFYFIDFFKNSFMKELEQKYSVSQIYESVLNNFIFDNGIKGVNGYSVYLFSKDFGNLTFKEKVFLALSTIENIGSPEGRYEYLSDLAGLITGDDKKITFNTPKINILYPDYVDGVLEELEKLNLQYNKHSYDVYTNLDEYNYNNIKSVLRSSLKEFKGVEASFVLIDYVNNKSLLSIGTINDDYNKNRALKIKREVGSVFKPVTFLTAFKYGYRPSFVLEDKPYSFRDGKYWYRPKNYEDFYMGRTNIRNGLIYSLNNLTIKLAETVGLRRVSNMATLLGYENVRPFYAMPLGSIPQTPFAVANSYAAIASYGEKCNVRFIDKVVNETGRQLYLKNGCEKVVDEKSVYQTIYLMKKVVDYGTARGKGLIPGTAGKTGTTNDSKDVWFVAIFPPYVGVLWVGYDDFKSLGDDASGGKIAAPIMAEIERKLLPGVTNIQFKVPEGIRMVKVVKGEDKLFDSGCGSFYYEMLNKNNLPDVCIADSLNVATKED